MSHFNIYSQDHEPLEPGVEIYQFDEDQYDMRDAPPCIRSVWLCANHPNHRDRWRLLSFFRGIGIAPLLARDAILSHPAWIGQFDRSAVADISWHTGTPKAWSEFGVARCYGSPVRCCRHYLNCDPANYQLALRYFYTKRPNGEWECYTFIKGKRVIVDDRTKPYLEPAVEPLWSSDVYEAQKHFLGLDY